MLKRRRTRFECSAHLPRLAFYHFRVYQIQPATQLNFAIGLPQPIWSTRRIETIAALGGKPRLEGWSARRRQKERSAFAVGSDRHRNTGYLFPFSRHRQVSHLAETGDVLIDARSIPLTISIQIQKPLAGGGSEYTDFA